MRSLSNFSKAYHLTMGIARGRRSGRWRGGSSDGQHLTIIIIIVDT